MKRLIYLSMVALTVLLLPVTGCKKRSPETDIPAGSDTPLRPGDGVTPVPDAIDLGMIVNGKNVKWASFNLGASTPEQFGLFLAWGDLEENKPGYQIPLGSSVPCRMTTMQQSLNWVASGVCRSRRSWKPCIRSVITSGI